MLFDICHPYDGSQLSLCTTHQSTFLHITQGGADDFHYLHFGNRTTDATVTVKVNSFTCSGCESWRKAGIMFRAGLGQSDIHSMIQLTGWGIAHQSRYQGSKSEHDSYAKENVWLRLVKEGNTVTSYVKKDGEYDFMRFHVETIDFGGDYYVGLAVTSHSTERLGTMDASEFEISDTVFSLDYSDPTEVGDTGEVVWVQQVKEGMFQVTSAGTDIGVSVVFFPNPHYVIIASFALLHWESASHTFALMMARHNRELLMTLVTLPRSIPEISLPHSTSRN